MVENPKAAAATLTNAPPPPLPMFTHSSSSLQFVSFVDRTAPELDHLLELDEGDVIWSSYDPTSSSTSLSPPRESSVSSLRPSSDCHRAFAPEKFGLSALLAESDDPTVRRRASVPLALTEHTTRGSIEERAPRLGQSAPVNMPTWTRQGRRQKASFTFLEEEDEKEEEDEEKEQWGPPHVMVARSHLTTFSVFEGAGRTLKGRDLRRVRNAVWKHTGFLD